MEKRKIPLENASSKRRKIESTSSSLTEPPHQGGQQQHHDGQQVSTSRSAGKREVASEGVADPEYREYKEGSVTRIKMKCFLTYDHCEVFPGPRLNVVIGPNGTGKSTLVCAIAIGLGGSIKILGRGNREQDFVKHGYQHAELEIELKRTGGNLVIFHRISMSQPSEWRFAIRKPGRPLTFTKTTLVQVKERVRALNVQIDNLCQFLPQDRVSAFARMDERNLLRETLKAIGKDEVLFNTLVDLIGYQKTIEETQKTVVQEKAKLQNDIQQNTALERDVERYRARKEHLNTVRLCQMKRPWLEYQQVEKECQEGEKELHEFQKRRQKIEQSLVPLFNQEKQCESQIKEFQQNLADLSQALRNLHGVQETMFSKYEESDANLEKFRDRLELLFCRNTDRKKEASQLKESIESKKRGLESMISVEDAKAAIAQLATQSQGIKKDIEMVQFQRGELEDKNRKLKMECEDKSDEVARLRDDKIQRRKMIQRLAPRSYQTLQWIERNHSQFREKILGPVCLEVTVSSKRYALCLEMALPRSALFTFVAQNEHDEKFIQKECKHSYTVVRVLSHSRPITRPVSMDYLRSKYGVEKWVDEIWEAPPLVKRAVLANYPHLSSSVIGTQKTSQMIGQMMDDERCKGISSIFTHDSVYSRKRSKYGDRTLSIRMETLKPEVDFLGSVDPNQLVQCEQQLKSLSESLHSLGQQIKQVRGKEHELNGSIHDLKHQQRKHQSQIRQRKELEQNILISENDLLQLLQEEDISEEIEKTEQAIMGEIDKEIEIATRVIAKGGQIQTRERQLVQKRVGLLEYHGKHAALKHKQIEIKKMNKDLEKGFDECQRKVHRLRAARQEKKRRALAQGELTAELRSLPDDLDELDALAKLSQSKADVNTQTDPQVEKEYMEKKKAIEELEASLSDRMKQLESTERSLKERKSGWMSQTKEIVNQLSDFFKSYMKKINCNGSVVLHAPENRFDEYGIKIMVKFRQRTGLQQLKGDTQSGGEKSVATMLYLVSLQPLTPCPFRLVDEINQGMDARNERMIFEQVVNSASEGSGEDIPPQYFLITPKLLPDLKFKSHMRVFCILNGPWQQHLTSWPLTTFRAARPPST